MQHGLLEVSSQERERTSRVTRFLERQKELQAFQGALEEVRAGHGQLLLVSGEAGIGKTTLVEAFVALDGTSCRVLRGYCDPLLTPSALGPLRDIERRLGDDLGAGAVGGQSTVSAFDRRLDWVRVFGDVVVFVFEDIHWADEATIDLLRFLSRRIDDTRIMLVATFRDDEVPRHDALRFLLGELSTNANAHRVELSRLSRDGVAELAGESVTDVEHLYRITGGNPFYVTEVLASSATGLPSTVRDAVIARAAQLNPESRQFLDLAAVVGARIDYELLENVQGIDEGALGFCTATVSCRLGGSMLSSDTNLPALPFLKRSILFEDVRSAVKFCAQQSVPDSKGKESMRGWPIMPRAQAPAKTSFVTEPKPAAKRLHSVLTGKLPHISEAWFGFRTIGVITTARKPWWNLRAKPPLSIGSPKPSRRIAKLWNSTDGVAITCARGKRWPRWRGRLLEME